MLLINILVIAILIFFFLISSRYESDFIQDLDEKQHPLKRLYPLSLYIMGSLLHSTIFKLSKTNNKVEDSLKALYVGEQLNIVKKLYACSKLSLVILVIFITNVFALVYNLKSSDVSELTAGNYIMRPKDSGGTKSVDLEVQVAEGEEVLLEDDIEFDVEERIYREDELDKLFDDSKQYIDTTMLNKNNSTEEILSNLYFPESIPNTSIMVTWSTGNEEIISKEGELHNEDLKKQELIWITATMSYGDRSEEYTRYVKVLPKVYTKEEKIRLSLINRINKIMEQSKKQEKIKLPDSLGNKTVLWREHTDNTGMIFIVSGSILSIILYLAMDQDLMDKVEKRNIEMLLDYPEIINKFVLFVGAGMSMSNAWRKITKDYREKGRKKRFAYEELLITANELMVGTSEVVAYERFGKRVKLLPYLRFSSLIAQNVKKGSVSMLEQLELEAVEAFEERKQLAKRLGEEAGTKLLLPMMLMLIIVLAIIMVPAFMSFQI